MFQKTNQNDSYQPNKNITDSSVIDDVETIVGPSVRVEGDFSSEGNIVVKGIVSGSVKTSKLLTVENGAKIFANVSADNANISGGIKGNVKVSNRLELTETAQIQGDIKCKVLSVSPGALLHGKVIMSGVDLKNEVGDKGGKKRISLGRTVSKIKEEDNSAE